MASLSKPEGHARFSFAAKCVDPSGSAVNIPEATDLVAHPDNVRVVEANGRVWNFPVRNLIWWNYIDRRAQGTV